MIHVIVGVQGSGKSTFAKELAQKENIEIVSTDAIRKNYKDIEEYRVWEMVYKRMAELTKQGNDCIFDATSITRNVRKRFFDNVGSYGVKVEADCYYPLDVLCMQLHITHKLIRPKTPWHNGKVERSHRNDQERFYDHLKFYSYDDLLIQMKRYLRRSNRILMSVLDWMSPLQKRRELEAARVL